MQTPVSAIFHGERKLVTVGNFLRALFELSFGVVFITIDSKNIAIKLIGYKFNSPVVSPYFHGRLNASNNQKIHI
jgi:hypothetical protein